jgi:hypothetical protein
LAIVTSFSRLRLTSLSQSNRILTPNTVVDTAGSPMDNDTQYLDYHRQLITLMRLNLAKLTADNTELSEGLPDDLTARLDELHNAATLDDSFYDNGQLLICRIIGGFPQLTPQIPRQLLWFFGGDCLHYMPDEEIELYQQLDELRAQANGNGEDFDFDEAFQLLIQEYGQKQ